MKKHLLILTILLLQLSGCKGQSTGLDQEVPDSTVVDTPHVAGGTVEMPVDSPPPPPPLVPCVDSALNNVIHEICFKGKTYITVVFSPQDFKVELFNKKKGGGTHTLESVADLKAKNNHPVVFSMNAGMYDKKLYPIGLYIAEGKEEKEINLDKKGYGNFYNLGSNAVFGIDDQRAPFLVRSQYYDSLLNGRNVVLATQSGPYMVQGQHINKKFTEKSHNLHIRNAVGITKDSLVVFAISEEPVNFYEFSELLRDRLGCKRAMYLDGAISQWKASDIQKTKGPSVKPYARVGPIIVISRNP